MADSMFAQFRRRFWMPPRAHGDIIEDRSVSFLELFYDLVYVVVIARAAHTLAKEITWRSVGEFVVIFALIWIAWVNGTLYYELHGREDGRTRVFVFIQMIFLTLLAVLTGDAAGDSGAQFAVVYILQLAVVSWLWYSVRRQDSEEFMEVTRHYLIGLLVSIGLMAISIAVPNEFRVAVWALLILTSVGFGLSFSRFEAMESGITITHSMVERFGLFVIIVLGEVVVGVVDGLSEAEDNVRSIVTGVIGLCVGFAYWWTYFDFVGRRLPVDTARMSTRWSFLHLPVTLSIAAAGAAMVSLIEHSSDARTPAATAWLLSGAVAVGLWALIFKIRTLIDYDRFPAIYRPVAPLMLSASVVAVVVAVWAPTPWLFALILVVVLSLVWLVSVLGWFRNEDADSAPQIGSP